jgi:flagellin-like hook-associated protein FlgL
MITPEQYLAVMTTIAETGELPALSIVRDLIAFDPNTLYRMGPGAAGELLDKALSRIDELTGQLNAAHTATQEANNNVRFLSIQLEEAKGDA